MSIEKVYFSSLEDGLKYINNYLEKHLNERTEVVLSLDNIQIDGENKKLYSVSISPAIQIGVSSIKGNDNISDWHNNPPLVYYTTVSNDENSIKCLKELQN